MSSPLSVTPFTAVDLSQPRALAVEAAKLLKTPMAQPLLQAVDALTREENPRKRTQQMGEVFRKLDNTEIVDLLKAGAKLAVRQEMPGIRLLLGFLEVKRPGVEVLNQLQGFSSLERVSLQLVNGRWVEADDAQEAPAIFQILEVLEEATRIGVLDLEFGRETLPRHPTSLRALLGHLRHWFARLSQRLDAGEKVPDAVINFITQLAMLELNLMERRVGRIASSIDPYDARGIGRLMPVLSFYDQDIEHMRGVVSRLSTYKPFNERILTMEHGLSSNEMERILKVLTRDPLGGGLARMTRAMRKTPFLDRDFAYLLSATHQVATLRAQALEETIGPDLLSSMLQVLEHPARDGRLHLRLEPELLDTFWPTLESWGFLQPEPGLVEMMIREDRAAIFLHADGTPRLPLRPREPVIRQLSLKDIVQLQINNDAFLLGVLDNRKATNLPGLVALIVQQVRSLRVLDKIISVRGLHTGPANKDVPRLLLLSPARIPVSSLKSFIHVRYVSKVDLERLSRPRSEVRPEVQKEIALYLRMLKKN